MQTHPSFNFDGSPIIATLGISDRCPKMCGDCALSLTPNGTQMSFSDIRRIVSFDDLVFRETIGISYGEPFYYEDAGKTLSDIATLFLGNGIKTAVITTSGFRKGDAIPEKALEGLMAYRENVQVGLSFNLFQGRRGPYWDQINYTVERLSGAGIRITEVLSTYSVENKAESEGELGKLVNLLSRAYGTEAVINPSPDNPILHGEIKASFSQIERVGRGERATRFEPLRESWVELMHCDLFDIHTRREWLTIRSNGDLHPCLSPRGAEVPPVANVFEHTWEGIKEHYRMYQEQFQRRQAQRPKGTSRCAWHRQMAFRPPKPRQEHLRQPSRAPALARA